MIGSIWRRRLRDDRGGGAALLLAAAGLLVALTATTAFTQTSVNATLRGTVTDSTGAVVPGAAVTLTNARTGDERSTVTDATGGYIFPAIVSGPYVVRVDLSGFRSASARVTLNPGDVRGLDITLEIGEQTEVVTVTAETEIIQTETGAREGLLNAKQIEDLSVVGRSSMELLRIMPGVVAPDLTQFEEVSFGGGSNQTNGYTVNGVRGTNNTVTLDGSNLIDIGSNNGVIVNPNNDMVEVVKVQSSNYAAEFGTSGVQVSAITKSGGNEFHGSVYGYLRDDSLAANDRSNTITGVDRPKSSFFYPGGNISGPIVKDKLFFFAGFEMQRQDIDTGSNFAVVPTLAQRQGDYSEFLAGTGDNLNQPTVALIPQGFPGAGTPAPNNNLAPYADPVGRAVHNAFPEPNFVDPNNRFNYVLSALQPVDREEFVLRLDYNISEATKTYFRASRNHETAANVRGVWWGASAYELPSPNIGDNVGQSYSVGVVSVLSPTMTNEVLVSFSRLTLDNDFEDRSLVSKDGLGISGFEGMFPGVSDLAPIGVQSWGTQGIPADRGFDLTSDQVFAHNDSLQLSNKLTKIFDTHAVKVGFAIERGQKQQNFQNQTFVRGQYAPWGQPSTDFVFGDIYTGRPVQVSQGTRTPEGEFQFWNVDAFVQDSWKITPNFTLEYGLRFSYVTNNEELNDIGVIFQPDRYNPSQGAFIDGDVSRLNGVAYVSRGDIDRSLVGNRDPFWLPRVNFAWDVSGDGELVVRGGGGMFFNRPQGNAEYDILRIPPNAYNSGVDHWSSGGDLLLSDISRLDPFTLLGTQGVTSISTDSVDYPTTISTSLSVAKRLPGDQVLEVAYVGTFGRHLMQRKEINEVPDGFFSQGTIGNADLSNPTHRAALSTNVTQARRPFPALANVQVVEFTGTSNYHSLQATLSRQTGANFQYFLTYTFSKALGISSPNEQGDDIDPFDARHRSYGIIATDRTHVANLSWNWSVPDLVSEGSSLVLKGLLNGWQLSGISTFTSGAPLKLELMGDISGDAMARAFVGTSAHEEAGGGSVGTIGPVFTGGNPDMGGTDVGERVADINQIGLPTFPDTGSLVQPFYIRYPSRNFHDITLMKNFPIGDSGKRLQFRAGFFNIFNQAFATTNANDVDTNLNTVCNVRVDAPNGEGGTSNVCDPTAGFVFDQNTLNNFGKINLLRGHRIIELALKFIF